MKIRQIIFLTMLGMMLSSCAAVDPTRNDLKSPCVANDEAGGANPCVRRKPLENFIV